MVWVRVWILDMMSMGMNGGDGVDTRRSVGKGARYKSLVGAVEVHVQRVLNKLRWTVPSLRAQKCAKVHKSGAY